MFGGCYAKLKNILIAYDFDLFRKAGQCVTGCKAI